MCFNFYGLGTDKQRDLQQDRPFVNVGVSE
jgi:hypothetical protein